MFFSLFHQCLFPAYYSIGADCSGQPPCLLMLKQSQQRVSVCALPASLKSQSVCVAAPSSKILQQRIELDQLLKPQDIPKQLAFYQSDYFPGIEEALTFDFLEIGQANKVKIYDVFAIRQRVITEYEKKLQPLGLKINAIEPENIAYLRAIFYGARNFIKSTETYVAKLNNEKYLLFNDQSIIKTFEFSLNEHDDIQESVNEFCGQAQLSPPKICVVFEGASMSNSWQIKKINLPKGAEKNVLAFGLALRGFYNVD